MEVHLSSENVFDTLHKCDFLLSSPVLSGTSEKSNLTPRWVEIVRSLISRLKDDCRLFIRRHYANVLEALCQFVKERKVFKYENYIMDIENLRKILVSTARSISSAEHLCRSYMKCRKVICSLSVANVSDILDSHIEGLLRKDKLLSILREVEEVLENSLYEMGDRISKCSTWGRLDTPIKERIKLKLSQHNETSENRNIRKVRSATNVPSSPYSTRLPRATKTTRARESFAAQLRNNQQNQKQKQSQGTNRSHPIQSSSESSRNSSPLTGNRRHVFRNSSGSNINSTAVAGGSNTEKNNTSGSPSMRRSLLLAAKAPQVPPSPSVARKGSGLNNSASTSSGMYMFLRNSKLSLNTFNYFLQSHLKENQITLNFIKIIALVGDKISCL